MAVIGYSVHGIDLKGGITLKAAGLVAADTSETGVFLGRGFFLIRIVNSAVEIASNDEIYNMAIEASTTSGGSTWKKIGNYLFSCLEANGGEGDSSEAEDVAFGIFNPYAGEVRVSTYVAGTIATGINSIVTAFPVTVVPH